MDIGSKKIIKTFKKADTQKVVNRIQKEAKTTELMRVEVYEDFDLEVGGVFRGCETSEEFYTTKAALKDDFALINDLANHLIDISL